MLFKKKNDRDEYLELKKKTEKLILNSWGRRCKLKDYEEFPDLLTDTSESSRCPACLVWDKFDAFWDYATPDE